MTIRVDKEEYVNLQKIEVKQIKQTISRISYRQTQNKMCISSRTFCSPNTFVAEKII